MSSEIECVDLIDSDEENKYSLQNKLFPQDEMIRCNLCLDPGLLPVEDDRSLHRISVHAAKLFYCDACEPHEKGGKGFENFSDVSKHVCWENGIDSKDDKNIHSLIRIPKSLDALKVFTCLFCSNGGMKFVGMSEDSFLEHIRNTHGNKAPRRRPEKLLRECRICGRNFATDADLDDHVQSYISGKRSKFAGFGPRKDDDYNDTSDEEVRSVSYDRSKRTRTKTKRKRDTRSSSLSEVETVVKSKKRKKTKKKHKEKRRSSSVSEEEPRMRRRKSSSSPRRSKKLTQEKSRSTHPNQSNTSLEDSIVQCVFCTERVVDLPEHLCLHHSYQCFQCAVCKPTKLYIDFDTMLDHSHNIHGFRTPLEQGHIIVPKYLGLVSCGFCSPPEIFIGEDLDSLSIKLFQHLEIHEDLHRGKEKIIESKVLFNCRLCPERDFILETLSEHILKHKQFADDSSSDRRMSPDRRARMPKESLTSEPVRSSTRVSQSSARRVDLVKSSNSRSSSRPDMMSSGRGGHRSPPLYDREPRSWSGRRPDSPTQMRRPRSPSPRHVSALSSSRRPRTRPPSGHPSEKRGTPPRVYPSHDKTHSRKPQSPPRSKSPRPPNDYNNKTGRSWYSPPSKSYSKKPRSPSPHNQPSRGHKTADHPPGDRNSYSRKPRSPPPSSSPRHRSSQSRVPRSPPPRFSNSKNVSNDTRGSSKAGIKRAYDEPGRPPLNKNDQSFDKKDDPYHSSRAKSRRMSGDHLKHDRRTFESNKERMDKKDHNEEPPAPPLENVSKEFKCLKCKLTFSEVFEAMAHVEDDHSKDLPKDFTDNDLLSRLELPKILVLISCNYCDTTFINDVMRVRAELRTHREVHKDIECSINSCFSLQCRICNLKYDGLTHIQDIKSHVNTHSRGNSRLCNYCFENFDSDEIGTHMIKNHKDNMFLCHLCSNPFHDRASINRHLSNDHGRLDDEHRVIAPDNLTIINCRVCNIAFYSDLNPFFIQHFDKVHNGKSKLGNVDFACRMCSHPEVYSSSQALKDHIIVFHKVETMQKGFSRTSAKARLGERRMNVDGINKYLGSQPPAPRRSVHERLGLSRGGNRNQTKALGDQTNEIARDKAETQQAHSFGDTPKSNSKTINNWKCTNCDYVNFQNNDSCRRCQGPKPRPEESLTTTDNFKLQIEIMMRNEREKMEIVEEMLGVIIANVFDCIKECRDDDKLNKDESRTVDEPTDNHPKNEDNHDMTCNDDTKPEEGQDDVDSVEEPSSPEYEIESDDEQSHCEEEKSALNENCDMEQDSNDSTPEEDKDVCVDSVQEEDKNDDVD